MIPETSPPEGAGKDREGGPFLVDGETDFDTETMRAIWRLFEGKRQGRAYLSRRDIDPAEFTTQLPGVVMLDVHRDPLRFRFRLAGTNWRRDLGFEPTGMWLHDWPHDAQRQLLTGSFTKVVESGRASVSRRRTIVDGLTLRYEALILPLSSDGVVIDMVMSIGARLS